MIVAALAVAGLAAYFIIKRRKHEDVTARKKLHHLTNAFSKAKEYAM